MRATMIDGAAFARAVADQVDGFATIDELVEIADDADVWGEMLYSDGIRALKKDIIRKLMRKKLKDENGDPIEWVNVVQSGKKGRDVQVYKQLGMFDMGDFEDVIRDRKRRVDETQAEFKRFCRLAVAKFGRKIQQRFEFPLPIDD